MVGCVVSVALCRGEATRTLGNASCPAVWATNSQVTVAVPPACLGGTATYTHTYAHNAWDV